MNYSECREVIARLSSPLAPRPTGVEAKLPVMRGVRAVVFDVYGTLLVSGSGDISLTSGAARGSAAREALSSVGIDFEDGDAVIGKLHEVIKQHHAARSAEYPEVDILDVWRETLGGFGLPVVEECLPQLATEYECRVNPVWPMPGMVETLAAIQNAKLEMGIVSNAQFFTNLAVEHLTHQTIQSLGFNPRFLVWSYSHLQAKPGRFLYDEVANALEADQIKPEQVLYLGNDMLNDVWPASLVGFRTALFAGDDRSLRLRDGDPRVAGLEPDAVVTDLRQLMSILPLAAA